MRKNFTLTLKIRLISMVAPGTVTGLVPYLLLRSRLPQRHVEMGILKVICLLLLFAWVQVYLSCIWAFMVARGIPAPFTRPNC